MGLLGGLKKIGRGIGKGVKKGVKAFDKFDDWIKLKELAQIGQFIPGVNVFAKPLAMTYAGFDAAKGIKEGNLMKAALAGASMYGSHKIKTSGFGGGVKELGLGQTGAEALSSGIDPTAAIGFKSQAMQNLKNYAGGSSNPLGLMDKYAGLDKGSKFAIDTLAPPILNQLQGDQKKPQGPIPSYGYQPMNYGPSQGFSPTSQFPTQARGGITGDDWHQPINRLPANYEGWVTQPSLATLGEAGKEAVLPLNKLIPAMNKGGLNYSPGQAIVGEAGPEYVKRLGPGEEQYAQSILQQQPLPQMENGGVAGEPSSWDQLRDFGGRTGDDIMEWGSERDPAEWKKRMLGFMASLAEGVHGKSMGALSGLGLNPMNLITGKGNWFGEDIGGEFGSGALWGEGTRFPTQQDYLNSREYELDALGGQRDPLGEDHTEDPEGYRLAQEAYQNRAMQIDAERAREADAKNRNTTGQMTAEQGGRDVIVPPGMSENEMFQSMQQGVKFPPVAGPLPPYIGPQGLDPALLDNYNAREWQRRAETSPEDKKRYEAMLETLIQQQNEGEVFPTPTYSATALDKMKSLGNNGQPTSSGGLTREQQLRRSEVSQESNTPPTGGQGGTAHPHLDRYPSEEGANIMQQGLLSGRPTTQQGPADDMTTLMRINQSRLNQGLEPLEALPEGQSTEDQQLKRSWVDQEPFQVPVDTPSPFPPEWDAYRGVGQEPSQDPIAPPTADKNSYEFAEIAQMLVDRGMPPQSAAHMAANIMAESAGRTGKLPHSDRSVSGRSEGTSGGAYSWRDKHLKPTGERNPEGRLSRMERHFGKKVQDLTLPEQIDYSLREMQDEFYQPKDTRYKSRTWDVLMDPNSNQAERHQAMKTYLGWGTEGPYRNPQAHDGSIQFNQGIPFFADDKLALAPQMPMAPNPRPVAQGPPPVAQGPPPGVFDSVYDFFR